MIEMVSLYMISLTFGNNLCFRLWVWSSVHNSHIFPNLCLSCCYSDRDLTAISSRELVAVPRYREPVTANYPCVWCCDKILN